MTGIRERAEPSGALRWEIDNPARKNAIAPESLRWIAQRCAGLRGEIVVLAGAEGGPFCSGFDLGALAEHAYDDGPPDAVLIAATAAMTSANATFVASIAGHAIGAGVELACACDLRIATTDASFEVPAGRLGVVYHADGILRMRATFGAAVTQRLLLLGEKVGVADALAAGAIVRVVERAQLAEATEAIVARLRELSPMSVRGHRDLLRAMQGAVSEDVLRGHEGARAAAYGSEDHREAREAVRERRAPRFRGE